MTPPGQEPELPGASLPNAAPETESDPFWSYLDMLVFAGLAVPSLLAGELIVRLAMALFHWHARFRVAEAVPAQFLGYLILFGLLAVLWRIEYDRPFWKSLGWRPLRWPPVGLALCDETHVWSRRRRKPRHWLTADRQAKYRRGLL